MPKLVLADMGRFLDKGQTKTPESETNNDSGVKNRLRLILVESIRLELNRYKKSFIKKVD